MEHALEVKGLRKSYNGFTLKDVSFCVPRGYIMGLIGPNGAGKTTTIKLILNLLRRDAGEVRLFGMDNLQHEVEVKSRVGFVLDEPPLYGYLTLERMKSVVSRFYPRWDDALFRRLAGEFDLPLRRRVHALSRGMKMKFALALALSHNADFIIMDEPTSGLDPVFRRELLERLSVLIQDEGKSVLFSTHITSDLERTADFITFIRDGEILFSTTKDEIQENWAVVKGAKELLNEETRSLFEGVVRESAFGFKALTADRKTAERRLARLGAVFEKATFDEIVLFLSRSGRDE